MTSRWVNQQHNHTSTPIVAAYSFYQSTVNVIPENIVFHIHHFGCLFCKVHHQKNYSEKVFIDNLDVVWVAFIFDSVGLSRIEISNLAHFSYAGGKAEIELFHASLFDETTVVACGV